MYCSNEISRLLTNCTKKNAGCLKGCISDASFFSVIFPEGTTKEDKLLLIYGMLLIDYSYFETNQNPIVENANRGWKNQ